MGYGLFLPIFALAMSAGNPWVFLLIIIPLGLAWQFPLFCLVFGIVLNAAIIAVQFIGADTLIGADHTGLLIRLYIPAALCIAGGMRLFWSLRSPK